MKIFVTLLLTAAAVNATFITLSPDSKTTLRKTYRTLLRYLTLYSFEPAVQQSLQAAKDQQDSVGAYASFLLASKQKVSKSYFRRIAHSAYYMLLWNKVQVNKSQLTEQIEQQWVEGLVGLRSLCTEQTEMDLIDRFMHEHEQGTSTVFGSPWGKGKLAREILDNPDLSALKNPQLKAWLQEFEQNLVQKMSEATPKWTKKRLLKGYLDSLLKAVESVLIPTVTPVISDSAPVVSVLPAVDTVPAPLENSVVPIVDNTPPANKPVDPLEEDTSRAGKWYAKIKGWINKRRTLCTDSCNRAAERRLARAEKVYKRLRFQQDNHTSIGDWLKGVKEHLSNFAGGSSGEQPGDGPAQTPAVITEEHQDITVQ